MQQPDGSTARSNTISRAAIAFLASVPIAVLGGLICLGGAEFRLQVLAGPLRYPVRQAVPLNLAVSLVTVGRAAVGDPFDLVAANHTL